MPNGKTHDIISTITTPIVSVVTYHLSNDVNTTIIITLSYVFSSLMFNGDLDIVSRPYNRWFILKFIWIPYQKIFYHRSFYTHGIIIGTTIRLLYLLTIPIIVLYFNGSLIEIIQTIDTMFVLFIMVGLEIGSIVHTISDKLF